MSNAFAVQTSVDVWMIELGCCGLVMPFPAAFIQARQRDHQTFWCPACGGRRVYNGESDLEQARRERDEARQLRRLATARADRADRSCRATKGHLTRAKKMAAHGQCPVRGCRRHFKNLEVHMSKQHPKYQESIG